MKYFPYENYKLKSKLPAEEIRSRIENNIEPKRMLRFSFWDKSHNKPYEGNVNGNSFEISRIIGYRNSFLPIVKGKIDTESGLTIIHVRMRMTIFVCLFMTFWLAFTALGTALIISSQIAEKNFNPTVLMTFGMFALGYIFMTGSFKYESAKTKKILTDLVEGEMN